MSLEVGSAVQYVQFEDNALKNTAKHCKTLQNTAKNCKTLTCSVCAILRQFWFLSYFVMNVFMFARIRTRTRTRIGNMIYVCTANLTLGDIFAKLFQSSKLKARTFLFTETRQKRRSSFVI